MKTLPLLVLLLLMSCSGSLSDEQRKQLREKMEENRIVRITDVEITEAAFAEGRRVADILDSLNTDTAGTAAFINAYPGSIHFLAPGEETGSLVEKQLIEAYLADTSGAFQDNVQNVRHANGEADSLLYTKPRTDKSGGNEQLVGVWSIWLSKKELVKEIARGKRD